MPRNVFIAIVLILVLGGGVWYFQNARKQEKSNPVVKSIDDLLSQSVSLSCLYRDEAGRETKTYIKNGAIRSDFAGTTPTESGSAIITDKKMYFWTVDKQGFMIDIPQVSLSPEEDAKGPIPPQKQQLLSDLEKYKDNCKTAIVSDDLFTPPTDVTFTDYSQMIQEQGAGLNPEQLNQYMQQYGQ